jgi:hypothetical protein
MINAMKLKKSKKNKRSQFKSCCCSFKGKGKTFQGAIGKGINMSNVISKMKSTFEIILIKATSAITILFNRNQFYFFWQHVWRTMSDNIYLVIQNPML